MENVFENNLLGEYNYTYKNRGLDINERLKCQKQKKNIKSFLN